MRKRVAGGFAAIILGRGLAEKLVLWRSRRIAGLQKKSGRVGNPAVTASTSLTRTLKATLIILPTSAAGTVLLAPWFVLLAMIPVTILVWPELKLRDEVAARREGVERELPFFSMLVGVLGGAGVPVYSILGDLASGDVFPSIKKEALLIKRDVEIFGMNVNDSLERLASSHPSKRFSDFLLGYTSKARSGGDVPGYLVSESGSLLRALGEGWARYVARVGIVGSMMITVFGVVPLLLMVVGVFSPGFSIVGLLLFTALGVPLFTIGILLMAGRMQPMRDEPIYGKPGRSLIVALPGAALGLATGEAWIAVGAVLSIFFLAYGLSVRGQLAETKSLDEGLSLFLKDLMEYERQDYDLAKAVVTIASQGGHTSHFGKVISKVALRLKAGVPLDEVKVECRSRLGRLTFLLLGQMSRSGGGSVETVYQASSFTDRLLEMRRNASIEMKPYLALSYLSPLLLAFGVAFVGGVMSSFSHAGGPSVGLHLGGLQFGSVPPGLLQVSDLLIVVSAGSLGLIGAKVTDMTMRNTLRASVNVALALASIATMSAIAPHSLTPLLAR
jgi:archaeal flagellar protein FlaJ